MMLVMMLVMSTTGYHYPRHYVLLMRPPSKLQRAVHWTPVCLHLHLLIEDAAMQENDRTEQLLREVHSGCHILMLSL